MLSAVGTFIASITEAESTLVVAVLGGLFAALGYVGKLTFETIRAIFDRRNARVAKLVELDGLLRASRAVYATQNQLANRLVRSIEADQPNLKVPPPGGLDATIAVAYADMTQDQQSTQGVIRSMSQNAMKPLNDAILQWLKEDTFWKAGSGPRTLKSRLARSLGALEGHLYLWQAKYAYWMTDPLHSLVYLADEKAHGVGFPDGLDALVKEVLSNRIGSEP
jgi:hypothetical protein